MFFRFIMLMILGIINSACENSSNTKMTDKDPIVDVPVTKSEETEEVVEDLPENTDYTITVKQPEDIAFAVRSDVNFVDNQLVLSKLHLY